MRTLKSVVKATIVYGILFSSGWEILLLSLVFFKSL